jgi:hypothetical protein
VITLSPGKQPLVPTVKWAGRLLSYWHYCSHIGTSRAVILVLTQPVSRDRTNAVLLADQLQSYLYNKNSHMGKQTQILGHKGSEVTLCYYFISGPENTH